MRSIARITALIVLYFSRHVAIQKRKNLSASAVWLHELKALYAQDNFKNKNLYPSMDK